MSIQAPDYTLRQKCLLNYARPFLPTELVSDAKADRSTHEGWVKRAEGLLLSQQNYLSILDNLSRELPNLVVHHTDPKYPLDRPVFDRARDVVVFLVGGTDHTVPVTQWRMEVINRVAKRVFTLLQGHRENNLVFIVPEYRDVPSKKFQGCGHQQLAWEDSYLQNTDIYAVNYDLKLKNREDGSDANVGLSVRPEGGKATTKVLQGKADAIFYTPRDAMGADSPQHDLKKAAFQRYPAAFDRLGVKAPEFITKDHAAIVAREEGIPLEEVLNYTDSMENFIDALSTKIGRQIYRKSRKEENFFLERAGLISPNNVGK